MQRGAHFINVSRGGIVDEDAVAELVRAGHLAGVAFDTFAREPLPVSSPLRQMSNAILTPHMIGHTRDSHDSLTSAVIENIIRMANGRPPLHLANPEYNKSRRAS